MRLIDADALLVDIDAQIKHHDAEAEKHAQSGNEFPEGIHRNCAKKLSWCERLIRNAPTVTLQPAEGDAISREAVLELFPDREYRSPSEDIWRHKVLNLPSIPATPAPDVDVVTVEEIVEGIEFPDCVRVIKVNGSVALIGLNESSSFYLSKEAVADLLTGALRRDESVTYPEGHKRSTTKPKQPTWLEALDAFIERHHPSLLEYDALLAAIEAERKGEGK